MKENNGKKFCGYCGAEMRGKFCPQCGKQAPHGRDDSGVYSIVFDRDDIGAAVINADKEINVQDENLDYYAELEKKYDEEIKANERAMERVKKEPKLKILLISVAFFAVVAAVILLVIFVPRKNRKHDSVKLSLEDIDVGYARSSVIEILGNPTSTIENADGSTSYWIDENITVKEGMIENLLASSKQSDWAEAARLLNELSNTTYSLITVTFDEHDKVNAVCLDTTRIYGESESTHEYKEIVSQDVVGEISAMGKFVGGRYTYVSNMNNFNGVKFDVRFSDGSFAKGKTTRLTVNDYEKSKICRLSFFNGFSQSSLYKAFKNVGGLLIEDGELVKVGKYSYHDLGLIGEIILPNGITKIGDELFENCNEITGIAFPNSLINIGNRAFYGCDKLTSIEMPNSVTSIGYSAFWGCSSLASVNIPNGVTSIGYSTFSGCSSLASVNIPKDVTSIGSRAFSDCKKLTRIEIPKSVISIEDYAFYNCDRLSDIYCEAEAKPQGWSMLWNAQCNAAVHWGYKA